MIPRVGIGLDNVDQLAAEERGIKVSYNPDAPAPAVTELTIGMMLTPLRSTHVANFQIHHGKWYRFFGTRLSEVTIGIIGVGRTCISVLRHLKGFGNPKILVNDTQPNIHLEKDFDIEWVEIEEIYKKADFITFHTPLTSLTKNMVRKEQLFSMKSNAVIINTGRGGIINEKDLYEVMQSDHLCGVAIEVFEIEPYYGQLCEIECFLLTAHMGSMLIDCRTRMEIESTEEAVRFLTGKTLQGLVPPEEYEVQRHGL
jgi:D-3-phosphoglycerate dehydrogenase